MDTFTLLLCIALILWGISVFVSERVLVVLAAIAAIAAGIVGLVRGLR